MINLEMTATKFSTVDNLIKFYDENYCGKQIKIEFDNGCIIEMKRKYTHYKNSKVVKTNHMHIIILYPSGLQEYMRENKNGKFTTTTSPYKWQQIRDFREVM